MHAPRHRARSSRAACLLVHFSVNLGDIITSVYQQRKSRDTHSPLNVEYPGGDIVVLCMSLYVKPAAV